MDKIIVSGIELTVKNAGEILKMSGPWVGDLLIGQELISKDCIIDNCIYKKDMDLLFFIKYHPVSKFYWYFTINFYNIQTKNTFEFKREFDMVHIGNFLSKNQLEIYPAFHDQFKDKRTIFNLDKEEFNKIS